MSEVAFDLYGTLLDPIGIADEVERTLAGSSGRELAALWRGKQLEYSFRLTVMDRYQDFRWVTDRALRFAAAALGVELTDAAARHLIDCYDHLPAFADALPALATVSADGHRPAVFSNGSRDMIENALRNSGLGAHIDRRISVDEIRAFKPSPAAYAHAARSLGVPLEAVTLVSCNPFDVVGASSAGMRTVWVNRTDATYDTIGDAPHATITSLAELPAVLRGLSAT